jgi:putative cell wall-binding protein
MRLLLPSLAILGLLAVSVTASAPPASAVTPSRMAGADRFATSVEISRQTPFAGDVVYLASGLSFPDALAAGPVAAAEGGHLLLTRPDAVEAVVMSRIAELAPSEIVLVGSAATVRESVRTQLAAAFPGTDITRIGGTDRVSTSLLLLERLAEVGPVSEIWVVSGFNFPDALVAASVAGATGGAVVLDWHGADAASARGWAERVQPYVDGMPVSIAGGTPSVSAADEALLSELGAVDIVRFAGSDRYDTARRINAAYPPEWGVRSMLLATGENFPDALAGAVHSAATGIPLYLSPGLCHATITPAIAAEADRFGFGATVGLGSAASISDLALSLGECPAPSAVQQQFASAYGVFDPISASGSGSATIAMPPGARVGVVSTSQQARVPLRAWTVAADGRPIELVADPHALMPIGRQSGERAFGLGGGPAPTHLYIETTGDWSVRVLDMRSVQVGDPGASGFTDDVWIMPGGVASLDHSYMGAAAGTAERGFEAWMHRPASLGGGSTLLASVSGPSSGRTPALSGAGLVTVRASGGWTLLHRPVR